MKTRLLFLMALFVTSATMFAQVGIGTATPDDSAILELESTSKGFLPPRLSDSERDGIMAPAKGLMIYNKTQKCIQVNLDGTPTGWSDCIGAPAVVVIPAIVIPAEITINDNQVHLIASIFDVDYLPYTTPSGPATSTVNVPADPGNIVADTTVDFEGVLPVAGITVGLKVVTTGSGTLPAFSQTVNVPANLTEDGIARDVTLSWPASPFDATTTSIPATLTPTGGDLNALQLDINAGIGNDALGIILAQFSFPRNAAGDMAGYQLRDIAAIPDRAFGNGTHDFLYLPVTNPTTTEVWLSNNLGANYANVNSGAFNLAQKATSASDANAYGSLYQSDRYSDGHEFRNSALNSGPNQVSPTSRVAAPNANEFISVADVVRSWYSGTSPNRDNLWNGTGTGTNEVCPEGFRLPTRQEFTDESNTWTNASLNAAAASVLAWSAGGARGNTDGIIDREGTSGEYKTIDNDYPNPAGNVYQGPLFDNTNTTFVYTHSNYDTVGHSVRCIKN